jgi:triosephosphate isomerase
MKFLIGNWKMQLSEAESERLADDIRQLVGSWIGGTGVTAVLCPSHLALGAVSSRLAGSPLALGAQDVFWEDKGAFTGEISPLTLKELGCRFCVVGHSERREHLGETDAMVNRKVGALLRHGLTPVVCVGETRQERDAGRRDATVIGQVEAAFSAQRLVGTQSVVVAYEPRWVIGTGQAVSPADAAEMHYLIRDALHRSLGEEVVERQCHVIYGGAVDSRNLASFLAVPVIDGALVGGASLKPQEFRDMVAIAADHQG